MAEESGIKTLNRLMAVCKNIVSQGAQRDWDLGVALLRIFNRELWTLIKGKDGEQRYKRFHHFAFHELSLGVGTVQRCLRFARTYKREQLKGVSSLVASTVKNVKDPKIRARLLNGPHISITYIQHQLDRLPPSAFHFPRARAFRVYYGSTQSIGDFLTRSGGRMTIGRRDDDFVVTYVTKGGVTRVGRDSQLPHAIEGALKTSGSVWRTETKKRAAA